MSSFSERKSTSGRAATKMTTTTALASSPKIPSSSSALTSWSFSPAAPSGSSGVSTPTSIRTLSSQHRSHVELLPTGKSLTETIVTLTLIGAASMLLASLETLLGGGIIVSNLALLAGLFAYQWTRVHSYKLDPRCSIIVDEANVLSITSNFDHEMLGFIQRLELTTKKPSESAKAPAKPHSLWDALFLDDRETKIEEFYRGMYGGEYALAQARWQKEEEMEQRMRRPAAVSVQKTQEVSSDEQKSPSHY
uniref:Uncharacterized protein n=1 Tax=Pristionchus pacificus TaxID=54126 RepID=A0A8R1UA67_PRIPA